MIVSYIIIPTIALLAIVLLYMIYLHKVIIQAKQDDPGADWLAWETFLKKVIDSCETAGQTRISIVMVDMYAKYFDGKIATRVLFVTVKNLKMRILKRQKENPELNIKFPPLAELKPQHEERPVTAGLI